MKLISLDVRVTQTEAVKLTADSDVTYIAIRIGVGAGLLVVVTATVVLTVWCLVKCGVCCALHPRGSVCFTLHCKFPKICDYEFCKFPNTHLLVCYELCCMYSMQLM